MPEVLRDDGGASRRARPRSVDAPFEGAEMAQPPLPGGALVAYPAEESWNMFEESDDV